MGTLFIDIVTIFCFEKGYEDISMQRRISLLAFYNFKLKPQRFGMYPKCKKL